MARNDEWFEWQELVRAQSPWSIYLGCCRVLQLVNIKRRQESERFLVLLPRVTDPGTVSWVFLNYISWKEGIHSGCKFHHQQPELAFTRLRIKNRVAVLLCHQAHQHTPCTVVHIAWLYFLDDWFVFGWWLTLSRHTSILTLFGSCFILMLLSEYCWSKDNTKGNKSPLSRE